MLQLFLWPVLAVWMGLALLVAAAIVGTLVWSAAHLLRDVVAGAKGTVWCPAFHRRMQVQGVPTGFTERQPFTSLRHCEQFGAGPIRCRQICLTLRPIRAAA